MLINFEWSDGTSEEVELNSEVFLYMKHVMYKFGCDESAAITYMLEKGIEEYKKRTNKD